MKLHAPIASGWFPLNVSSGDAPAYFASPFEDVTRLHPWCLTAASQLMDRLSNPSSFAQKARAGKMFGVLVARRDDGQIGYLQAFSGMIDGSWIAPGFAPPAFDLTFREEFWPQAERQLDEITQQIEQAREATNVDWLEKQAIAFTLEQNEAIRVLRALHAQRREGRKRSRESMVSSEELRALEEQSRADKRERRDVLSRYQAADSQQQQTLRTARAVVQMLKDERQHFSQEMTRRIHDTYIFHNAQNQSKLLRELFVPNEPPTGAGDCAGPKLLAHAYRSRLVPLAMSEFWWGEPPISGGRIHRNFYPACRGKCGPILSFMLQGLPAHSVVTLESPHPFPALLPVVFEDEWIIVVNKPSGLLSVPGKLANTSCAEAIVQRMRPDAAIKTVHRLDMDTSGLLIAAKDGFTHTAMQKLFVQRSVSKEYFARVHGVLPQIEGVIDLPLRLDVLDRPRQIVDFADGKPACTHWQLVAKTADTSDVLFRPLTGRTHQLRVHAAHHLGLGTPIVGDRLYGTADTRLLLHASALRFNHPHTGKEIHLRSEANF